MVKKTIGRAPSLDLAGERRAILKNLRFSKTEWAFVEEKMREAKISEFSEYARLACLQVSPIVLVDEGFNLLAEIRQNIVEVLDKLDRLLAR